MIARERALGLGTAILLIAGGVLGGGPTSAFLSMFVELIACALAVPALAGIVDGHYPKAAMPALILIVLVCFVPLLQLVPLPASLWASLPGRDVPGNIAHIASLDGQMRPLSLDPEQTRLGALALIVPIAAFIATLQLGVAERNRILIVVLLFALVSALLAVFQVSAGGGLDLGIYPQIHDGYAIGFFANRNHESDLMLIAIPFSAYVIRTRPWRERTKAIVMLASLLFFSLSVVATISRGGVSILPLAIGGAFAVWVGNIRDRGVLLGVAGLLLITVIGYLLLDLTPLGSRVLHRFSQVSEDLRPQIWQGSITGIKSFWPWGSGVGSFVPVYDMFEDLNSVSDSWVNHAHDDYLELLLVAGLPAAILLIAYVALVGTALLKPFPSPIRRQRYAAVTAILILMTHSLVDYPLRTSVLLAIFACSNAMLFAPREAIRIRRSGSHPVSPQPVFVTGSEA